jgi:adenylate cyclase
LSALAAPASASVRSGRILVVDDNENNREVLSRKLVRQGHQPFQAKDGVEALEMLRAESYDAVLLDITMPRKDGYAVLEELKADNALRHVPVIMISAIDSTESIVRCIQMGAEDYLPKPFNTEILQARLTNALARKFLIEQIRAEKERSDQLLHVIFPDTIVQELKATNEVRPRRFENVAVLFSDIVGFTAYCDRNDPEKVVSDLQELTCAFEESAMRCGVQKVKTIGDAFMGTSGLLNNSENPVLDCVRLGLDMVETARRLAAHWHVRVGINVGPVVAGVVGQRQYLFDVWGDTVNTAARCESHGQPDAVNVSGAAWHRISEVCRGESLGMIQVKGKGEIDMWRVDGLI